MSASHDEIARLKIETNEYIYRLNAIVGFGALTAAVACLGTRHPSWNAFLIGIVAVTQIRRINSYYPKTALAVRELLKAHPNDPELRELEHTFNTKLVSFHKAGISLVPLFIGTIYFVFVLFLETLPHFDKTTLPFVNWFLGRD